MRPSVVIDTDYAKTFGEIAPEAVAAADWWADVLAKPGKQDNGDGFQSGFATALMLTVMTRTPMTDDEATAFRDRLATRLQVHIVKGGWERARTDPNWGGAVRCVGVDYGPDILLESALIAALGLERARQLSLLWPIKTAMWINPGEVRVRHGYGAESQRIFPPEYDCAQELSAILDAERQV